MKKLLALILILTVMSSASLADSSLRDITGSWYFYYSKDKNPEFSSIYNDSDYVAFIITCCDDGTVLLSEFDIKDKQITPTCTPAGKWEKAESGYQVSIVGLGEGEAVALGDYLYVQVTDNSDTSKGYIRLHRLVPLDPYNDYIFK